MRVLRQLGLQDCQAKSRVLEALIAAMHGSYCECEPPPPPHLDLGMGWVCVCGDKCVLLVVRVCVCGGVHPNGGRFTSQ